jgi:hypothetical protein
MVLPWAARALPAITQPPAGQPLPTGWSFWSESAEWASAAYGATPVDHLAVRIYNPGIWSLHVTNAIPAQPGQVWTFSAVVGGRSLGHTGSGSGTDSSAPVGGLGMSVVALDSNDVVLDWFLGGVSYDQNSFGWKQRSMTVVVPPGTAKLRPRFVGEGGGEAFVQSAAFEQTPFPIVTVPPYSGGLPSDWTTWQRYVGTITANAWTYPFNYLAVAMAGYGDWEVGATNSFYAVSPGEWWTFSALVNATGLGQGGGGAGLGVVAYDSANNVVNWNLGNAPSLAGNWSPWLPTSVTFKVPAGVPKVRPRFTGWGGGNINYAYAEFQRAMPPIAGTAGAMPDGWGFWQEYAGTASAANAASPSRIHTNIYSGNQFELDGAAPFFNVEPGQQWTLSAELSGTNLGAGGGGVALNVVAMTAAGTVVDWTLGGLTYEKGTFGQKTVTKTVTVPAGVAKLQPRFYGYANGNGASFDIYSAKFERASYPAQLTVPSVPLPPVTSTLSPITVPDSRGLPSGWTRWSQSYGGRSETTSNLPVPHLAIRYYNYNLEAIYQANTFSMPSAQDQTWTFTAVISGRNLRDGGMMLSLDASNGTFLESAPISGTFGWQRVSYTVLVPRGVTVRPRFSCVGEGEFFVASATFLRTDEAADLPVPAPGTEIPPTIVHPPMIRVMSTPYQLLPLGWKFTVASPSQQQKSAAQIDSAPVTHLAVRAHSAGDWELRFEQTSFLVAAHAGETWTFTAVAGRRALAPFPSARVGIAFDLYDAAGTLLGTNAGVQWFNGTFAWQKISATVAVPLGVAKLRPKLVGEGGGELFVSSVAVEQRAGAADLFVPSLGLPAAGGAELEVIPIVTDVSYHGMVMPGSPVTWTVAPSSPYAGTASYTVVDLAGTIYASGSVALGTPISFTPPTQGYYELRASGTVASPEVTKIVQGLSSCVCVPTPSGWSYGAGSFGTQGTWDWVHERAGFALDRPLNYNIVSGAHDQLPTDLAAYSDAWEAKKRNAVDPVNAAKYINSVEIWNEPEWELGVDAPGGPTMQNFIDMVQASWIGIGRVDSTTKILVNFASMDFSAGNNAPFKRYQALGGWQFANVMALHPYAAALYSGAPFPESPEHDKLLEKLANARAQLNAGGWSGIEIWSTEYGWPTYPGFAWSTPELDQARFIVRSSLLQLAAGVRRVIPFRNGDVQQWIDDGEAMGGSFGLTRLDGTAKPAFAAYVILTQTVYDLPYVGYLSIGTNVAAFVFGRSLPTAKTVVVLWRPDTEANVTLGLPSGTKTIVEMLGKTTTTTTTTGWTRPIGRSPTYVVISATPAAVAAASGYPYFTGAPAATLFNVAQ